MKAGERLGRGDRTAIRILSNQHLQSGLFPYQGHMRAVEREWGGEEGRLGSVIAPVWQEETEQLKLRHHLATVPRGEFSVRWNNDKNRVAGASSVT